MAHQFSIDCSRAHRGMFAGIIVIVVTIISLIMYFVLHEEPNYIHLAITEVTYYEIVLYTVCTFAVFYAMYQMRDMKFQRKSGNNGNGKKLVFHLIFNHFKCTFYSRPPRQFCQT